MFYRALVVVSEPYLSKGYACIILVEAKNLFSLLGNTDAMKYYSPAVSRLLNLPGATGGCDPEA